MVKILLRILGGILAAIILLITAAYFYLNEKEPTGVVSAEADQLAEAMMASVNKPAWDSTRWVNWSFLGMHHFLWDKETDWVKVNWDDYEVLIYTKELSKSQAFQNGELLQGEEAEKATMKAWDFFCNDSFWLNPVVKAFDPGTERSLVDLPDGNKGLKVKYTSGGVTPGDSYLWILDEQNRPKTWKMWVQNLPVDGFDISWEGWETLPTGAQISTVHGGLGRSVTMITNLKAGMDLSALGIEKDPFQSLR